MADDLLTKWLAILDPLACGQFGDTRANGMALTCGQFWLRTAGGYNLYRWTGDRHPVDVSGGIVGAAPAGASSIANFDYVTHAVSTRYWYLIRAVGAGGVEESNTKRIVEATFDAEGDYIEPAPNSPFALSVEPAAGGYLTLRWLYDAAGQAAAPSQFNVYHNNGSGEVDYDTPVTNVSYTGSSRYTATVGPYADDALVRLAVRAAASGGAEETNTDYVEGLADATAPATPTVTATHGEEEAA